MNTRTQVIENNIAPTYWAKLFLELMNNIDYGLVELTAPCGEKYSFEGRLDSSQKVDMQIHDWKFCEYIFTKGDIGLGEAYIDGLWSTSDISKIIEFGVANEKKLEKIIKGSLIKIIFYRIKHLMNRNTVKGSKKNIHAHYDLGNDFYKLWLDSTMTYSSAYFKDEKNEELNVAQNNKYERMLQQLKLEGPSEILEIGCGWGGFAEVACLKGHRVTCITISKEQYDFAKDRLSKFGNMATVLLKDYRELEGKYDHIVSIEMFEALGESYWDTYFKKVRELLSPQGRAVIQTITINNDIFSSYRKGTDFIQQYIFPGGMLPSPEIFIKKAKKRDLYLLERLDFGEDYALTLNKWYENFKACILKVKSLGFDEKFIRTWVFYLKYCEGGFNTKRIGVSQFTLGASDV